MGRPRFFSDWCGQVALGAVVVAVLALLQPQRAGFYLLLLLGAAVGSFVGFLLRAPSELSVASRGNDGMDANDKN